MILRHAVLTLLTLCGVFLYSAVVRAEEESTDMPAVQAPAVEVELPDITHLDDYTPPPMFNEDSNDKLAPEATEKEEVKVFPITETKKGDLSKIEENSPEKNETSKFKTLKTDPAIPENKKKIEKATKTYSSIPIPTHRPAIIKVSPDYIEHLRSGKSIEPEQTNTSNNAHKFTNKHNMSEGRLKNADIYDVLKQIDPDAAEAIKKPLEQKTLPAIVTPTSEMHRVTATSLPDKMIKSEIHINFVKNQNIMIAPLPQETLENILLLVKTNPDIRIEITGFPSNNSASIKDARALSYNRATSIKTYLKQNNIPENIIDIITSAGYQSIYDRVDIKFQKIM